MPKSSFPLKVEKKQHPLEVAGKKFSQSGGISIHIDLLTWPMAKRLKLFGITYLVGKIKFKLCFQGPLAE